MECGEVCKEAGKPVENGMLTFELEAAEVLAGLVRSSSLRGEFERRRCQQIVTETLVVSSQPSQALGGQQLSRKTSTMVAGPTNTLKAVDITSNQTCNTSNESKVSGTLRHNLTEAEKEARRLHRVLANRESARQTIRRREPMHLELTGKAANLSIENTYLKQERELALKKYNYLKNKNEFLKAQMVKRKHAETQHMHDRPESSRTEISSSAAATTPICSHKQPCLVPFFWPFNSQCASNPDFTNGSQFPVPIWDESCLNQGQECSTAITKTRPPFFILPVSWLLPFLSPSSKLEFHSRTKDQHMSLHRFINVQCLHAYLRSHMKTTTTRRRGCLILQAMAMELDFIFHQITRNKVSRIRIPEGGSSSVQKNQGTMQLQQVRRGGRGEN